MDKNILLILGKVDRTKYRVGKICALLVALLIGANAWAQADRLLVYGTVKDERSGKKLSDVQVNLIEDGETKSTFVTTLNGKFELDLDFGHDYDIRFLKGGYVSKFININTQNVPEENKVGGFGFDLDMSLFEEIEGVNFDILKKPIGKAKYVEASGVIGFDYEYTRSIQAEIARLRRELEKKYKEEEERLRREQEEAERLRKLQEQFDALVAEGDSEFSNTNYMNAVFKYSDALDLISGVAVVEQKLAKAKAALEEQQRLAELEEKYKNLIRDADAALNNQDFEGAKAKYEGALALKANEAYPQQQINTINKELDRLKAEKELEAKYKELLATADGQMAEADYDGAIANYNQALALKPKEAYPNDQIAKAQAAKDEAKRLQELEEQYNSLIASADKSFTEQKFEDAIGMYQEALKIKVGEAYPTEQIGKAKAAIAANKKEQELNEQYNSLIAAADKNFGNKDFGAAIADYTTASELKPEETYPKDQISKAKEALAALEAEKQLNERYNQLIVEADANMNNAAFTDAITNYKKALELKPNEAYPTEQITKAQSALDDLQKQEELEQQYKDLITKADGSFGNQEYSAAISVYQQALVLKPSESYPKDQIKKAQDILDAEKKQEEQYNNLIAKADGEFEANDYESAISNYESALGIKPNEVYPVDQIAKAKLAIEQVKEAEAQDAAYQALVKEGDAAFGSENYENAIAKYTDALAIKTDEAYPQDQITKAQAAMAAKAEQQKLLDQYNNLVLAADGKFDAKNYPAAISDYQAALQLRPDEKYPKDQIAKANAALQEQAKAEELRMQYQQLVDAGDKALEAGTFDVAINNYQAALQVIPDEQYPKDQIAKAEAGKKAAAAAQAKEAEYQKLIAKADGEFSAKSYNEAIGTYTNALAIKENEAYPTEQIAKARKALDALAEAKQKDLDYNNLIAEGDRNMNDEVYDVAIQKYTDALAIKPNEQYPKDQIDKANKALEALAEEQSKIEEYNKLILSADGKFDGAQWEAAIADYEAALFIKSGEQYPKDQIAKAQAELDALLEAKAMEQKYADLLQKADVLFDSTEYNAAIKNYQAALQLKPGEGYPKTQIAEAEKLQALKEKRDQQRQQYLDYIEQADAAFDKKQYKASIVLYQDALSLVPGEQYPKDQIAKAQAEQLKLEKAYQAAIEFGDGEMSEKRYLTAITSYENALAIFPDEQYPKDQIEAAKAGLKAEEDALAQKQADELLKEQQKEEEVDPTIVSFQDITSFGNVNKDSIKAATEEPKEEVVEQNPEPKVMYKTTSEGDLDAFRKLLGENYPEGITREKYRESNKDIFRIIFVENGLGDELLRVVARFGTFYFKNGSSISSVEYNNFLTSIGATPN